MTPTQDDPDTGRTEYTQEDFAIGDTVVDREQEDSEHVAVVVNRPPMAAEDWEAYRVDGEAVTVADDNPDYDPTANVVVVIYPEDLEEWGVEWDADDPIGLADAPTGIAYAFPPARLEPVGTYSPANESSAPDDPSQTTDTGDGPTGDDATTEPASDDADDESLSQDRLDAIAAVVEELNVDNITVDSSREAVIVEKLGEQYDIDIDGSVDADDLLAQRLEDVIDDRLDE